MIPNVAIDDNKLAEHCGYVLSQLEHHLGVPVPSGIYAGGAISSLVLGRLWGCTFPIIDRFELFRDHPDLIEDDECFEVIHYTRPFSGDHGLQQNGYTIISSSAKDNLIIRTCFRIETVLGSRERSLFVLKGVGLNALQVAAISDGQGDLQLFATEDFWEFVTTKQLRITTPVFGSTYFTLGKYRDLYGAYVDWDEEALLMSGFRLAAMYYKNAYDDVVDADGHQLFEKYCDCVARHCTVAGTAQLVLPGMENLMGSSWHVCFDHPKAMQTMVYIHQILGTCGFTLTSHTFTSAFNMLVRKSSGHSLRNRFNNALSYPFATEHIFEHPRSLCHDFSIKNLDEIKAFRNKHIRAMNVIMEISLNFADQAASIKMLKKLGRFHGNPDFVIGLVEQAGRFGIKLKDISEWSINELVNGCCSIGTDKLVDAADLSKFKYRDVVSEITTSEALLYEGWRCSHCIGGYSESVKRAEGNLRIFHLNTIDDNQHSTAAIYFERQGGDHDVDYELYGPKNADPTERHRRITNSLAGYLRNTLWRPEFSEEQTIDFNTPE